MVFFHVFIKHRDKKGVLRRLCVIGYTQATLLERVVKPYNEGKCFHFMVSDVTRSEIEQIYIFSSTARKTEEIILPDGTNLADITVTDDTIDWFLKGKVPTILELVNSDFITSPVEEMPKRSSYDRKNKRKVFIVHGRDEAPALTLQKYLRDDLDIEAETFDDLKKKRTSVTIIELLEYIVKNVGYAFVVATPDDMGCLCADIDRRKCELLLGKPSVDAKDLCDILEKLQTRARQNVVFEQGLFLGVLGRERVLPFTHGY